MDLVAVVVGGCGHWWKVVMVDRSRRSVYNGGVVVVRSLSHVLVISFFCIVVETSL